uniref:charged multivesicular body protein 4c-like n=1 Tax=Myxine glutinosa TaxID=7769 RepID=UPI00358EA7A5
MEFKRVSLQNAALRSMEFAPKALENVHKDMDINKVHDVQVQEQQELGPEISDAISRSVGVAQAIDKDELPAELVEIQEQFLIQELLAGAKPEMPSVSTTIPAEDPGIPR